MSGRTINRAVAHSIRQGVSAQACRSTLTADSQVSPDVGPGPRPDDTITAGSHAPPSLAIYPKLGINGRSGPTQVGVLHREPFDLGLLEREHEAQALQHRTVVVVAINDPARRHPAQVFEVLGCLANHLGSDVGRCFENAGNRFGRGLTH